MLEYLAAQLCRNAPLLRPLMPLNVSYNEDLPCVAEVHSVNKNSLKNLTLMFLHKNIRHVRRNHLRNHTINYLFQPAAIEHLPVPFTIKQELTEMIEQCPRHSRLVCVAEVKPVKKCLIMQCGHTPPNAPRPTSCPYPGCAAYHHLSNLGLWRDSFSTNLYSPDGLVRALSPELHYTLASTFFNTFKDYGIKCYNFHD